jgi:hypothetical protein
MEGSMMTSTEREAAERRGWHAGLVTCRDAVEARPMRVKATDLDGDECAALRCAFSLSRLVPFRGRLVSVLGVYVYRPRDAPERIEYTLHPEE